MRDRIDMMVDVPRLDGEALFGSRAEESTATVRERVAGARARQAQRADGTGVAANALLDGEQLVAVCRLDARARDLLTTAGERSRLSARGYHRVLRVSRTIADLAGEETVGRRAVLEAFQLRGQSE
jgi:magnesium chelatase family protein